MAEDPACPIILGRPFLATVDANISVRKGVLTFNISDEVIEYSFNKTERHTGPMEEVKSISARYITCGEPKKRNMTPEELEKRDM